MARVLPGNEPPLALGEKVVIMGKRKGTVRFIGDTAYGPGEWVGVELEKPTGTHDGFVNGQRYFTCPPKYGVYVQRQGVTRVNSSVAAASQIQSMQRGRKERQEAEFKRAFQTWNALEKAEENQYLTQSIVSSRVESLLRSYSPASAAVNGNSAVSVATAAGVSTNFADWGSNMTVAETYAGPHVTWPLTFETLQGVLHHIRTKPDTPIHQKYVCEILGRASQHFSQKMKDSVHDMTVPTEEGGKLVIVGDTHGQLADFLWVLKQNGEPGPKTAYLINGDIADRGDYACEIFVIVLLFMLLYPDRVSINRGNHENLEMNRRPAEVGGGFFEEISRKYDAAVFMMFQQLFELLPLATVISKRVIVVHGGLPRREGVLVQHLRTINRRRQCPVSTDGIEDALMFDLMWADPQDQLGVARASHRGSNCICFGPDVTKRFLGTNGLSLVIRSHEVPENLRGFEDRHEGRLLTVFTASNYCGSTGNYGAVVVFQADLSFSVEEHMAPDLELVVREYLPEGSRVVADLSGTKVQVDKGRLAAGMREEVLNKIRDRIAIAKDDLWWYWSQLDRSDTGKVTAAVWRQGMISGLQLDLPWFSLQKDLVEVDEEGYVDYKDFLKKCNVIKDTHSALGMHEGWEREIVNKAYEAFLAKDLTLQQVLKTFDSDGDGLVSAKEFRQAIAAAQVDLPETQVNAVMRAIVPDDEGQLRVESFLERFQVVCSLGADRIKDEGSKALLDRIGRILIGTGSRVGVFRAMDIDQDGYVDEKEFLKALDLLEKGKPSSMSREEKQRAWSLIDVNSDGHLNYLEFCAAFKVVDTDTAMGQRVTNEVVEAILAVLQKHAGTLSYAFRYFDPKGKGSVSREDFKTGLRALNASMAGANGTGGPLTDDQLEVFAGFVDVDGDGNIDYQEFLNAFKHKKGPSRPGSSSA